MKPHRRYQNWFGVWDDDAPQHPDPEAMKTDNIRVDTTVVATYVRLLSGASTVCDRCVGYDPSSRAWAEGTLIHLCPVNFSDPITGGISSQAGTIAHETSHQSDGLAPGTVDVPGVRNRAEAHALPRSTAVTSGANYEYFITDTLLGRNRQSSDGDSASTDAVPKTRQRFSRSQSRTRTPDAVQEVQKHQNKDRKRGGRIHELIRCAGKEPRHVADDHDADIDRRHVVIEGSSILARCLKEPSVGATELAEGQRDHQSCDSADQKAARLAWRFEIVVREKEAEEEAEDGDQQASGARNSALVTISRRHVRGLQPVRDAVFDQHP
jgi:hypothetical protein